MAASSVCGQVAKVWTSSFERLNRQEPGISGLLSFSEAWLVAKDFLHPRDIRDPLQARNHDLAEVKAAFNVLSQRKMLATLLDDFVEDMRLQLPLITSDIEAFMSAYEMTSEAQYIGRLVMRLFEWYKAWSPIPELGNTIVQAYTLTFQTHVFSVLPPSFTRGFKSLIMLTFDISLRATAPAWLLEVIPQNDTTPIRADVPLWTALDKLGLLDRYESLISNVCYEYIESYILETCANRWDESMLTNIRDWMADRIVPWMMMPYARGARSADEARSMLQGVGSRLDFHVCKTLSELRTREIFDIIIDYPDSASALKDLKDCLQRVDHRAQLVQSLRKANKRRLLHPGADTKDILAQYVSIIRCLRIVDPPGVLLFKVADPIRRYLRDRPDTIRCIVASLVGDGESGDSLVNDNEPIQPLQQPQGENYSDPNWEPEPIDAGPDFRTNKPSDVISTLVSIYDSKELFVKELQVLLAQRLLAITDGNYDSERRNIEILKIRFGEIALQVCEVMLKDMTDSKRTDQHVQTQNTSVMHPTIISKHFWPTLQSTSFEMPGQFKELRDRYAKEFQLFKPDKKLHWLPHLGTINLDIELDDRTLTVDVQPLEAAIIELFSEKDVWTVDEIIARVSKVDRAMIIRALGTWLDHGVVKDEGQETFRLLNVSDAANGTSQPASRPAIVDEPPPIMTVQQQQAEQMQVFWKFIEGMLKNLGTLPLDRIQTMLKFAPGYDRNIDQLGGFMEVLRRQGMVTVKDGMWKLS